MEFRAEPLSRHQASSSSASRTDPETPHNRHTEAQTNDQQERRPDKPTDSDSTSPPPQPSSSPPPYAQRAGRTQTSFAETPPRYSDLSERPSGSSHSRNDPPCSSSDALTSGNPVGGSTTGPATVTPATRTPETAGPPCARLETRTKQSLLRRLARPMSLGSSPDSGLRTNRYEAMALFD